MPEEEEKEKIIVLLHIEKTIIINNTIKLMKIRRTIVGEEKRELRLGESYLSA